MGNKIMDGGHGARIIIVAIGVITAVLQCLALTLSRAPAASAQNAIAPGGSILELSAPDQSTEDFAREWRRVRQLLIACDTNEVFQQTVVEMEDALVQQKLALRLSVGATDSVSDGRRLIPRRDRIRASRRNCGAIGMATYDITSEYFSYVEMGVQPPIYRAPRPQ